VTIDVVVLPARGDGLEVGVSLSGIHVIDYVPDWGPGSEPAMLRGQPFMREKLGGVNFAAAHKLAL